MNAARGNSGSLLGALSLTLLLGGCALSNPYVKVPIVDATECGADCTIDQAQAYSRAVREAFRQRLGTHAKVRNNSGAAEILLGAAALGLGAADAHRDAFVSAGLAGATTYGLSTWFGNPDLEKVYASAMLALGCAEASVEPLRLSGDDRRDLTEGLRELATDTPRLIESSAKLDAILARARNQLGALSTFRAGRGPGDSQQAQINALNAGISDAAAIASLAGSVLARANAASGSGLRLRHLNGVAGNQLARTVERIVAAVDDEARKAQPDPAAALKIVADLSGLATKVVPGLNLAGLLQKNLAAAVPAEGRRESRDGSTRTTDATGAILDELATMAAQVSADARSLGAVISRLEAVVAQTGNVDISAALAQCGIAASSTLSLMPTALELVAGASSAAFRVSGGKPPYSGTIIGTRPAGMVLDNPLTGDRGFTVTIAANTPVGDYVIAVSDATMKEIAMPVKVKPATTQSSAGPSPPPNPMVTPPPVSPPASSSAQIAGVVDSIKSLIGKDIPGKTAKITAVNLVPPSTISLVVSPSPDAVEAASLKTIIGALPLGGFGNVKTAADAVGATLRVESNG